VPDRLVIAFNGSRKVVEHPFAEHPIFALSPDVSSVTIVRRAPELRTGAAGRYTVTRIAIGGDTLFHREFSTRLEPLTRRTRAAVIEEYASQEDLQGMTPSIAALRKAIEDSLHLPHALPPVTKILVGTDGSTWLRGPDDWGGTVRWLVLDASGEPRRTILTDRRLGISTHEAFSVMAPDRNGAWGTTHDELGVTYLERYELRPHTPQRR
jgi:hypothetical protein